jgi:hypothetical protein
MNDKGRYRQSPARPGGYRLNGSAPTGIPLAIGSVWPPPKFAFTGRSPNHSFRQTSTEDQRSGIIEANVLYHSVLIAHYSGEFATSDETISKTNDRRQVSAAWKEHIVSHKVAFSGFGRDAR